MRAIAFGKANLYALEDERTKTHFYIKAKNADRDTIVELIYKRFLKDAPPNSAGYDQVGTLEGYKWQLEVYFADYPEIAGKSSLLATMRVRWKNSLMNTTHISRMSECPHAQKNGQIQTAHIPFTGLVGHEGGF